MPRTPIAYTGVCHLVAHGLHACINGRHGVFGTVAGYAMEKQQYTRHQADRAAELGITPEQLLARQVAHAVMRTQAHNAKRKPWDEVHRMHWFNLSATCLVGDRVRAAAMAAELAAQPRMAFGDRVVLEGCVYSLQPAPNDNVALDPVDPEPDTLYL